MSLGTGNHPLSLDAEILYDLQQPTASRNLEMAEQDGLVEEAILQEKPKLP